MINATVTQAITVTNPIYGSASFNVNDTVTDAEPYFFSLLNAGVLSFPGAPITYKLLSVYAPDNPPDGYFLRWSAAAHAFVPADPSLFQGPAGVYLGGEIVGYWGASGPTGFAMVPAIGTVWGATSLVANTTFSSSNPPDITKVYSQLLFLKPTSPWIVTWAASIKWPNNTPPILDATTLNLIVLTWIPVLGYWVAQYAGAGY